jgi:hydroxymethylbilane synthase
VPLESTGDIDLVKPIYELGVQGVFTKELDIALLNKEADAAVHSLKDIPIVLAKGLQIAAVLERASYEDLLITKGKQPESGKPFTLATSSIRRKAQWLEKYPHHHTENVRGNVETRIKKLMDSDWDGLLMAKAAVERLDLKLQHTEVLTWMLPAPGQGAIAVVCREDDADTIRQLIQLNHEPTFIAVSAERQFLHDLKGGCSAPISAFARFENDVLSFDAAIHSLDGKRNFRISKQFSGSSMADAGKTAAQKILASPEGVTILNEIFQNRPEMKL